MATLAGPTNFVSTANASGYIVLTWTNVTGNTGYTLLRSTTSGDYSAPVTATVATNVVTYTASTGLTLGTPYYFVARTSNANGLGANSAQATATPRTVPSTMSAPTLTPGNVNISVGYVAPDSSNGSAIISYSIQRATVSAMTTGLTTVATLSNPYPSTGITNGTAYFYRVAASNAAGLGTYSAVSSATPANVPAIVVFSSTGAGVQTVSLTWTAPANNGAAITSYDLKYSTDTSSGPFTTLSSGLLVSPFVATGLTNGSLYYFQMAASNVMGYGPYSLTASNTPRTVPDPITDLSANPSTISTSLILSWSAPWNGGSAITGYRWFRSSNADMSGVLTSNATLVTTLSTTIPTLVAGTTYYFQVVASNVAGFSASSATVSNYPRAVPGQVGTITATSLNQSISLSWLATTASNGSPISSYLSEYSLSSGAAGPWYTISSSPANTIVATGLSNGTSYYFRATASNVAGYGLTSAVVTKIPYTVPDKVGTITVTPLNASVSLAWPTTTASNGTAITSYYYYWSLSGSGTWTGVSNASTASSAVKTLLTNGSTYSFCVAASNAAGFGLSSDIVSTIPRTVPGAPTSVAAAVRTFDSVTVTFVAPASNGGNAITSYIVTPLLDGTTAQSTVTASGSPIIVSNAIPGRGYTYRVVASNDAGIGTSATSASVITYYNLPVENPNGNTYTYYASNQPWSSKVIYNLNYADVEVKQTSRSVWTISYNGLVDTLNYVRNVALADRNVWIMDISYGAGLGNTYSSLSNNLSNGDVLKVGSGEYLAATEPTIIKSITLEGQPDGSSVFGVAPGVSTYCLKIQGDNITARNLTLTTCYAQTTYTRGDYLLLASGANLTISGTPNVIPSLSNILVENMTIVNPYTLNSTASELQYWRNRRGISFNSVSGLTIRNCTFPKTWNYDLTLASCRNVTLTGNTFYACPWSTVAVVTTAQIMMKAFLSNDYSEYESSNINIADNTYSNFGDPSISTIIASPSYGQGATSATYITPLQNPVLTFQASSLSYAITYSSNAGAAITQIPADFRYSFVASPLLAYVSRDPLDLPQSFWSVSASSVVVTDLSTNTAVYPPGYCPQSNRNIYKPTLALSTNLTKGNVTVTVDPLIPYATYAISLCGNVVDPSNSSGSYTFLGAGLTDGEYLVSVTGTDGFVTSDTSNVYFTFDTTPPTISNLLVVTAPGASGNVVVNFDVTDPAGIAIYTTYLNDVSYADSPALPETVHLSNYGTHTIKVGATDSLGNTGFSSPLSVVYAPTPSEVGDVPIEEGQTEMPLNVGGNVVQSPIVPVAEVNASNITQTLSTGSYVVVANASAGTAAFYTDDNTAIGAATNTAFNDGVNKLLLNRGSNIITYADIGSSSSNMTVQRTVGGNAVTTRVDTATTGENKLVFAVEDVPTGGAPQVNVYFKYVDPQNNFILDGFEIYTEFDAPQFARMNKVSMYRSEDNRSTYAYDGDALKKAGTAYTFSYTFTQNSDYRLQAAYGSGIGDPYIMTIQGNLYKIPPFNGPMRLYQGAVGNQLLTVNATTRIDDDKSAMDGDTNAVIQTLNKPTGPHDFNMTDAMSFFEKIYISYGGKSMVVNVYNNEFRVEGATPETWEVKNAGRVQSVGNTFDFYSNLNAYKYEISPCAGVTVRIGIIPIRSVRTSVDIFAPNMEGGNGAFVHRLSRKAMTLRKLNSEAPVERRDCPVKRTLGEVFVCNEFTKEKQIPFVG